MGIIKTIDDLAFFYYVTEVVRPGEISRVLGQGTYMWGLGIMGNREVCTIWRENGRWEHLVALI